MYEIGDIVKISWRHHDSPIGIIVKLILYNSYKCYYVKWFDSDPQNDGEYLETSLTGIDNDND